MIRFKENERGFTLVELLTAVAIVGIIAAVAIPNLLEGIQKAKQKKTMEDMRSIATAIGQYLQDNNIVPQVSERLIRGNLSATLVPTYMGDIPEVDGWGNPFRYRTTARDSYRLISRGRDGLDNTDTTRNDKNWDHDLVITDGFFTASPDSGN